MIVRTIFPALFCCSLSCVMLLAAPVANGQSDYDDEPMALFTGIDSTFAASGELHSVASYRSGKMDGTYELWYESGQKWFEGNFKEGKPFHVLTEYYQDGTRKMELLRNENYEKTKAWYENGNVSFVMEFMNGQPHNKHAYWYPNGKLKWEGQYESGKKNGTWSSYTPEGVLQKRENFEANVMVMEENYHGGMIHGDYNTWYPSGNLRVSGMYVANVKHGKWQFFNPAGQLIREEIYESGKLVDNIKY